MKNINNILINKMFVNLCKKIYFRLTGKISKNLNFKDLDHFYPEIKKGRVIKVYDGDTITIAARVPKLKNRKIYKFNIRLNRIDTPEIRSQNPLEKELAIKIRDKLSEKIMNKMINVKILKTDKYGRYLAEIFYKKENINNWLLNNNYASEYNGGKKLSFSKLPYFNPRIDKVVNSNIVEAKIINPNNITIYDEENKTKDYYLIE